MANLLRYADGIDVVLMVSGTIGAIGDGVGHPVMIYVLSKVMHSFGSRDADLRDTITKFALYLLFIGAATGFAAFVEGACWMITGERQSFRMRSKYLRAILRQDASFFDVQAINTAEVVDKVTKQTAVLQEALCEKVPHLIMNAATIVGGWAVAFLMGWRIALPLIGFSPVLVIPGFMYGRILSQMFVESKAEYLKAATVAEQAISSIRTVYSFVAEKKIIDAYSSALNKTEKMGIKEGLVKGISVGSSGLSFGIWAFLSWYGTQFIINGRADGSKIITAGYGVIIAGIALGNGLPSLKHLAEAQFAALDMHAIIVRIPEIDCDNMKGIKVEKIKGELELRNVEFSYPSRPETLVLKKVSLKIEASKSTALVGGSGSGKSTVMALIERFYNPTGGEILLDGININELQLKWFRCQIGLVSQEPALFATTIKDNIMFGNSEATMEDVIAAAVSSNAHQFISQLPQGYDTQVGQYGVQMSGGQKQRIAIARALLVNPRILLLDEATSALDAESEKTVQAAIDQVSIGRTTIFIAHRLSTIRNCDSIAVVENGNVVETGKHDELLSIPNGTYYSLIKLQEKQGNNDEKQAAILSRLSAVSANRLSVASRQSNAASTGKEITDEIAAPRASFGRAVGLLNREEWKLGLIGSIGAVGFGMIQPIFAFFLGEMISTFYIKDHHQLRAKSRDHSLIFVALAVATFLFNIVQHYNFAVMGESLTKRIRQRMLAKILSYHIGWFDEDKNSSARLSSMLATQAHAVRALVGDRTSLIVQTIAAVVCAGVFGLVIAWKLALVMIAVQPLVILCYYGRKVLLKSILDESRRMEDEVSEIASEAVSHHRIITAFSGQDKMMEMLEQKKKKKKKNEMEWLKPALVAGIGLGSASLVIACTWALDFWYGSKLVQEGSIQYGDMFKTFLILVSSGRVIAEAGSMTSDIAKGGAAVASVFGIFDGITRILADDPEAEVVEKVEGNVEIKGVDFAYPARPELMIFRNLCLKVTAGKSLALVGQSGSGKSTIISLIERFYDPLKGKVKIDGKDVRTLELKSLRRHISLVGQEPVLFGGSIRDNILYGNPDATEAEIIQAAIAANAHEFISCLKDGYDTETGERGVKLSGGQKQRVAIARAIIRKPSILLLDEATSALDSESEKLVQSAIERVMMGRTSIIVAHRLTSIENADRIAVIEDGSVVESGSHDQLMSKGDGGAYHSLFNIQVQH